jgi:hypothetical protein
LLRLAVPRSSICQTTMNFRTMARCCSLVRTRVWMSEKTRAIPISTTIRSTIPKRARSGGLPYGSARAHCVERCVDIRHYTYSAAASADNCGRTSTRSVRWPAVFDEVLSLDICRWLVVCTTASRPGAVPACLHSPPCSAEGSDVLSGTEGSASLNVSSGLADRSETRRDMSADRHI